MNKIGILISGNIRIYPGNLNFLKEIFRGYEIYLICSVWENQDKISEFKKIYNINYIQYIKEKNWDENIKDILYVTGEENRSYKVKNIFHMWCSIVENIKFLRKVCRDNEIKVDYICRFRSDLFSKSESKYFKKELKKLKKKRNFVTIKQSLQGSL